MDLQLIFLPEPLDQHTIKGYYVGIQNSSASDFIYTISIHFQNKNIIEKRGTISSKEINQLEFMPFDELNNNPEFNCDFWEIIEEQTGKKQRANCKIKPKQFFAKKIFLKSIQREVIQYQLQNIQFTKTTNSTDLSAYTKENIKPKIAQPNYVYNSDKIDLVSKFEFVNEIDLHLENLTQKSGRLSNGEKLELQLSAASEFINKAIKVGVTKVYLIHGIGKGKLKERIHDLLHKHQNVRSYKNEFNHKYGYGATEVIFRK